MTTTPDQEIWNASTREISGYPLLDEIETTYGLSRADAHAGIWAYVTQLIGIDGEDAVILAERPARPELLARNPSDLDVHYWITISGDAIETVREAFAAAPADEDES